MYSKDRFVKNKGKICYNNRRFENPFFRNKKKSINVDFYLSAKAKLAIVFLLAVIAGIFYFFMYSTYFHVTKIEIEGLNRLPKEEIENIVLRQTRKKRFGIFSQRNIFIFDKEALDEELNKKYCFQSIEILTNIPDSVSLVIEEKPYAFIWVEGEKYYYSDEDGYIIEEVNPLDIKEKKYPVIENLSISLLKDKKIGVEKEYTDFIQELYTQFNRNPSILKISDDQILEIEKFIIDNDVNTVKILTRVGPSLYFNIYETSEKQIEKLIVVKTEKLKNDFCQKAYIDLRYGDKVYYR